MILLFPVIFLSLFGFFNIFGINQSLSFKHLLNIFIGFIFYFLIKKFNFNFFKINSKFFYWFFLILLILTFFIGLEIKGSKRWIDLGFFNFQPSEFLKPFFILFLSDYLSKKKLFENNFFFLFKSFLYFFVPFFVIFLQPDLANSLVYLFVFLILLIFSRIEKKYLIYFFSFFIIIAPLIFFLLKPYQKQRIISFLNPSIDVQGSSYNIIQSIITVGSGGFLGRGLGLGTQSRLYFLPENTTDFAFASLVEQFGFFGGFFVIIFYCLILFIIIKRVYEYFYRRKEDEGETKFLFSLGSLTYIVFQFFINVGMNLGILPVAGVALSFISYGGSAIIAFMITLALIPLK